LQRVLSTAENSEIIYAVNSSGAYLLSDNIAFSGGIAWSVATLTHPELYDRPVVPVTFDEIKELNEKLYTNFNQFSPDILLRKLSSNDPQRDAVQKEVKRVLQVFDQKALMAGTGLLVKMMRQFSSIYETKQFYLVKTIYGKIQFIRLPVSPVCFFNNCKPQYFGIEMFTGFIVTCNDSNMMNSFYFHGINIMLSISLQNLSYFPLCPVHQIYPVRSLLLTATTCKHHR